MSNTALRWHPTGNIPESLMRLERKVNGRPFEQVDIREFGVRGDGNTDDTTAFGRATSQLGTAGGGVLMIPVPKVHYLVSDDIAVPSNVTIRGTDKWKCKIVWDGATSPFFGFFLDGLAAVIENVTIENLYLQGFKTSNFDIIEIRDAENVTIQHCVLDTAKQYHIGTTRGINHNLRVLYCDFLNIGTVGIENTHVPEAGGYRSGIADGYRLIGNTFKFDPAPAAFVGDGSYGVKTNKQQGAIITGNQFFSGSTRSGVHVGGTSVDTAVVGNHFFGTEYGVTTALYSDAFTSHSTHTTIAENTFDGCFYSIYMNDGNYITIADNVIANPGSFAIYSDDAAPGVRLTEHALIQGNVIDGQIRLLGDCTDVTIRGNRATEIRVETVPTGSQLDVHIVDNIVDNANGFGIVMGASGGEVRGNRVIDANAGAFANTNAIEVSGDNVRVVDNISISRRAGFPKAAIAFRNTGTGNTYIGNRSINGHVSAEFSSSTAVSLAANVDSPVTSVSAAYTPVLSDYLILCDATSAAFSVTLPAANTATGRVYVIKKTDSSANAVTVDGSGTETIDGATTHLLRAQYTTVTIQSDGSNWFIEGSQGALIADLATDGSETSATMSTAINTILARMRANGDIAT